MCGVSCAKVDLLFPEYNLGLDCFRGNLEKSCRMIESCGFPDGPRSFPCLPPFHPLRSALL